MLSLNKRNNRGDQSMEAYACGCPTCWCNPTCASCSDPWGTPSFGIIPQDQGGNTPSSVPHTAGEQNRQANGFG